MAADGGQAAGEKREKPKGQETKTQEKEKVNRAVAMFLRN